MHNTGMTKTVLALWCCSRAVVNNFIAKHISARLWTGDLFSWYTYV